MMVETRKVFVVLFSLAVAVLIVFGFAFLARMQGKNNAKAPVSIAGNLPSRTTAPDAYANTITPAPIPEASQPEAPVGDNIIIYYGDKPDPATLQGASLNASGTGSDIPPGTDGTAQSPQGVPVPAKDYSPATATPSAVTKPAVKPASTAKVTPKVAAKPAAKPTSVTEYWIQAASLASRSRAEDMQRDIASKGLSSVITVKDIDGKTWYRIRIGPYRAKNEAQGWLEKIKKLAGCTEAYMAMQTVQK